VLHGGGGGVRDWQSRAPYAAVAWSLVYAAQGVYWVVSGRGVPRTAHAIEPAPGHAQAPAASIHIGSNPALVARHRPLRPLCDAKFGRTVRSGLYDDLYIVP
jgi:hypothetical protein